MSRKTRINKKWAENLPIFIVLIFFSLSKDAVQVTVKRTHNFILILSNWMKPLGEGRIIWPRGKLPCYYI